MLVIVLVIYVCMLMSEMHHQVDAHASRMLFQDATAVFRHQISATAATRRATGGYLENRGEYWWSAYQTYGKETGKFG